MFKVVLMFKVYSLKINTLTHSSIHTFKHSHIHAFTHSTILPVISVLDGDIELAQFLLYSGDEALRFEIIPAFLKGYLLDWDFVEIHQDNPSLVLVKLFDKAVQPANLRCLPPAVGNRRQVGTVYHPALVGMLVADKVASPSVKDDEYPCVLVADDCLRRQFTIHLPQVGGEVAHQLVVAVAIQHIVYRTHLPDGAFMLAYQRGNPFVIFLVRNHPFKSAFLSPFCYKDAKEGQKYHFEIVFNFI